MKTVALTVYCFPTHVVLLLHEKKLITVMGSINGGTAEMVNNYKWQFYGYTQHIEIPAVVELGPHDGNFYFISIKGFLKVCNRQLLQTVGNQNLAEGSLCF